MYGSPIWRVSDQVIHLGSSYVLNNIAKYEAFRSAGILTLLSAAIQWWTFILASMVNLDALSLLNQMPSQSRVTLRAGTCLAGLQVGHTWWIAHVLIGGAVPI